MSPFRLLLILFLTACGLRVDAAERPNIVLVLTDDQGIGDLGLHGNRHLRTPHLNEFAQAGLQLKRFYVEPVCAPTRAALMTGRHHYRTGVIHTSRGGAKMAGDERTVAEYLRAGGYRTGIFGKWHLGDNHPMRPQDQGFEETLIHKSGGIGQSPDQPNSYFNPWLHQNGRRVQARGYCTDVFFGAALEFIQRHREEPFFVYLPLNAPHTPLEVPDRYVENYRAMDLDETTARVYGMVENIDDNFGHLLEKLGELGLRENTLVLFMTDNGAQQPRFNAGFRGRKSQVYEGGIRVPCFLQWPAEFSGPGIVDTPAAHIDLLPTFLDFAGARPDPSAPVDGRSLRPLLNGNTTGWPDRTLCFQVHRGLTPRRYQNFAAVTRRHKLVGHPGTFGREDLAIDESRPQFELYDLQADPGEQTDLAARHPDIVRRLRADYDRWFDSVKGTRGFRPGIIHLGHPADNPVTLCRYQDSTFVKGQPTGWTVKIETAGRYRVEINRGPRTGAGRLHLRFNDREWSRPLLTGANAATFTLPAGEGQLDIWTQEDGQARARETTNTPVGDATLTRL
jgi:arylsulfatase A-like enzyme